MITGADQKKAMRNIAAFLVEYIMNDKECSRDEAVEFLIKTTVYAALMDEDTDLYAIWHLPNLSTTTFYSAYPEEWSLTDQTVTLTERLSGGFDMSEITFKGKDGNTIVGWENEFGSFFHGYGAYFMFIILNPRRPSVLPTFLKESVGIQSVSLAQSREEYKMGIKSKAELEVAEEEYQYQVQKSRLQMQSLRHDSVATRLRSEIVRANHEAENKKLMRSSSRVENLVVRATVAGQLSYVGATPGQQVPMGSSVAEIKVLSQYKVHTSVSEYYIDRIHTGLPANVKCQDKKFPLQISHVVPEVKDRQFGVDLVFSGKNPDNLHLGKSYRVQMELGKPEHAIIIPRGDFYATTGGKWIYRLSPDGKTARKVEVEIGRQNPQYYEVLSGLKPGDKVIVTGYDKFGEIEELLL